MHIYTRLFMSIAFILISSNILAKNYKNETIPSTQLTIPVLKGGFNIGVSVLYMTPSSDDLIYLNVNSTQVDHVLNKTYQVSPNYNWGFILDLGYVFPNTAHDIRFDWMAFHSNYSNEHTARGEAGVSKIVAFFPLNSEALLATTDFVAALATINYKLDALDITFGQYLTVLQRLQARVFSGLRYARFDSEITSSYTASWGTTLPLTSAGVFTADFKSSFNGVGPMIGTKTDVNLGKGLGLTGTMDIALLAGQLGFSGNQVIQEITGETRTKITDAFNWGTNQIVVPAFDAKFGLNYLFQFNNGTELLAELGYQVTHYFDVIKQIENDLSTTTPFIDTDVTDFGLRGPYFTLNVKI